MSRLGAPCAILNKCDYRHLVSSQDSEEVEEGVVVTVETVIHVVVMVGVVMAAIMGVVVVVVEAAMDTVVVAKGEVYQIVRRKSGAKKVVKTRESDGARHMLSSAFVMLQ